MKQTRGIYAFVAGGADYTEVLFWALVNLAEPRQEQIEYSRRTKLLWMDQWILADKKTDFIVCIFKFIIVIFIVGLDGKEWVSILLGILVLKIFLRLKRV